MWNCAHSFKWWLGWSSIIFHNRSHVSSWVCLTLSLAASSFAFSCFCNSRALFAFAMASIAGSADLGGAVVDAPLLVTPLLSFCFLAREVSSEFSACRLPDMAPHDDAATTVGKWVRVGRWQSCWVVVSLVEIRVPKGRQSKAALDEGNGGEYTHASKWGCSTDGSSAQTTPPIFTHSAHTHTHTLPAEVSKGFPGLPFYTHISPTLLGVLLPLAVASRNMQPLTSPEPAYMSWATSGLMQYSFLSLHSIVSVELQSGNC